jgi:YgiT-type zinc finger domain-containing protein
MKCVVCRHGETRPGTATVTLERDGATVVVKGVPARVCEECGEEYVNEDAASRLLAMAEDADRSGINVEVRAYEARPAAPAARQGTHG